MRVALNPGVPGGTFAVLRALNGHDELALNPTVLGSGSALVGRVLVGTPGTSVAPETIGCITLADRDRLLAAIYRSCYGDAVEAVTTCGGCHERFEVSLSLEQLLAQQSGRAPDGVSGPDDDGFFRLDDGTRFRPPTIADLEAVASLSASPAAEALLTRCVPGAAEAAERVQAALERLAPLLDVDLDAACPACAAPATVRFSMEAFLLRALANERRFVTPEVHTLAMAYGWGLDEILRLGREERRTLVRLVDAERAARGVLR